MKRRRAAYGAVRADFREFLHPVKTIRITAGNGRTELLALVTEMAQALSPERSARFGRHVSLTGLVGFVDGEDEGRVGVLHIFIEFTFLIPSPEHRNERLPVLVELAIGDTAGTGPPVVENFGRREAEEFVEIAVGISEEDLGAEQSTAGAEAFAGAGRRRGATGSRQRPFLVLATGALPELNLVAVVGLAISEVDTLGEDALAGEEMIMILNNTRD